MPETTKRIKLTTRKKAPADDRQHKPWARTMVLDAYGRPTPLLPGGVFENHPHNADRDKTEQDTGGTGH